MDNYKLEALELGMQDNMEYNNNKKCSTSKN